jgi:hypothetical protein
MARVVLHFVALCAIAWAFAAPAYAYLDPGTGSALLQALVGGIALVAAVVTHRWHQLRSWFAGRRTSADTRSPEQ